MKKIFPAFLLLLFFLKSNATTIDIAAFAQQPDSSVAQKDIRDLFFKVFKKQEQADTAICQPFKLYKSIIPAVGYSLATNFVATFTTNTAFYLDKPDKVNLSVVNIEPTITTNRQIIIPLQSNIWTKHNNYNFLGNWIFLRYPQNTYGLGGYTKLSDAVAMNYNYILIRQSAMRKLMNAVYAGVGYNLDEHWNIVENSASSVVTDFDKYGKTTKSTSSGMAFILQYDNRANSINAEKGFYCNAQFRQNLQQMGSNSNWSSILIDTRKFFLIKNTHSEIAIWSYDWLITSGNAPYFDLPSTGWDTYANQGRGYIQSRFRGHGLLALELEYRFRILKNGLLGGVIFNTLQSVQDYPSNRFRNIWPAVGAGLRIKLNKRSNTNGSIDYAVGKGNSSGFFINLGEMF